jgi:hypothetical protein
MTSLKAKFDTDSRTILEAGKALQTLLHCILRQIITYGAFRVKGSTGWVGGFAR